MKDKAQDDAEQADEGVQPESVSLWPILLMILLALLFLAGAGGLFIAMRVRSARMASEVAKARADLHALKTAVRMYRITTGQMPTRLADLTGPGPNGKGPWIESIPNDPWGRPYRIELSGRARIVSDGADGEAGTADDAELQVPFNNSRGTK